MIALRIMLISAIFFACHQEPPEIPPEEDMPLKLIWSHSYEINSWGPDAPPTILHDSLLLFTGDNNVTCLRLESGTAKWVSTLEYAGTALKKFLFDETRLFGWKGRDEVFCLDISDGSELWEGYIDSSRLFSFTGSIDHDSYYIGTRRDIANKYTIWKYAKDGMLIDSVHCDHMPWILTTYNGMLYNCQGWFPSSDASGQIICYQSDSLDTLWLHAGNGSYNMTEPQIENGILYAGTVWGGSLGNEVVALNAETGALIWRTETFGCYQIVMDGDVLYCDLAGGVLALDKNTGASLWETHLPVACETSALAYWDGYLYNSVCGGLYIFDAESGEIAHRTLGPDKAYIYQVSAGAGKIFVQTSQHLYAFEPFNPEALTTSNNENSGMLNPL